eukprot:gene6126-2732_t
MPRIYPSPSRIPLPPSPERIAQARNRSVSVGPALPTGLPFAPSASRLPGPPKSRPPAASPLLPGPQNRPPRLANPGPSPAPPTTTTTTTTTPTQAPTTETLPAAAHPRAVSNPSHPTASRLSANQAGAGADAGAGAAAAAPLGAKPRFLTPSRIPAPLAGIAPGGPSPMRAADASRLGPPSRIPALLRVSWPNNAAILDTPSEKVKGHTSTPQITFSTPVPPPQPPQPPKQVSPRAAARSVPLPHPVSDGLLQGSPTSNSNSNYSRLLGGHPGVAPTSLSAPSSPTPATAGKQAKPPATAQTAAPGPGSPTPAAEGKQPKPPATAQTAAPGPGSPTPAAEGKQPKPPATAQTAAPGPGSPTPAAEAAPVPNGWTKLRDSGYLKKLIALRRPPPLDPHTPGRSHAPAPHRPPPLPAAPLKSPSRHAGGLSPRGPAELAGPRKAANLDGGHSTANFNPSDPSTRPTPAPGMPSPSESRSPGPQPAGPMLLKPRHRSAALAALASRAKAGAAAGLAQHKTAPAGSASSAASSAGTGAGGVPVSGPGHLAQNKTAPAGGRSGYKGSQASSRPASPPSGGAGRAAPMAMVMGKTAKHMWTPEVGTEAEKEAKPPRIGGGGLKLAVQDSWLKKQGGGVQPALVVPENSGRSIGVCG